MQVNVGGLVASTLNLSDEDFPGGRYTFSGANGARIVNHGALNAHDGGYIALLGGQVSNQGVIRARLGTVALAAGERITLDGISPEMKGSDRVQFSPAHDQLLINHGIRLPDGLNGEDVTK